MMASEKEHGSAGDGKEGGWRVAIELMCIAKTLTAEVEKLMAAAVKEMEKDGEVLKLKNEI